MTRVFVDTNVLFPFSLMDLMPALTEDSVHEVRWTQALLAEQICRRAGTISHVFDPVSEPDRHADQVLGWLRARQTVKGRK
jgi:hypothetical protein